MGRARAGGRAQSSGQAHRRTPSFVVRLIQASNAAGRCAVLCAESSLRISAAGGRSMGTAWEPRVSERTTPRQRQ